MSRSGYTEGIFSSREEALAFGRYRGQVTRSINSARGQKFLVELARELDAMPVKVLIKEDLIDEAGACCTLGVVAKSRKIDVSQLDINDAFLVGEVLKIGPAMAAEIAFHNDEAVYDHTPEARWVRMRRWVAAKLKETP